MPAGEKLVLIDGNSLAYRAYFSHLDFRTAAGEPTGAIFGFLRMLDKVQKDERPQYLAVVFDAPGATFRDAAYAEYKANRQAAPDDFKVQMPRLRQVLAALNIPSLEQEGYEADDLIGTLSRLAADQGLEVVIVTGDRDALQLVDDRTTVLLTRRGVTDVRRMDPAAVQAELGVAPAQVPDLKGLMGDASDNIPGVPGVGEKTAAKLVQQFGSVEAVLERVDEVTPPRVREALKAHGEQARLSKALATIDRHVPGVALDLDAFRVREPNYPEAQRLFRELEFRSLLPRVTPPGVEGAAVGAALGAPAPVEGAAAPGTGAAARGGQAEPAVGAAESVGAPAGPGGAAPGAPAVAVGAAAGAPGEGASMPLRLDLPLVVVEDPQAALAWAAAHGPDAPPLAVLVPLAPVPAGTPVPGSGRLQPQGLALAGPREVAWVERAALPGLDAFWPRAEGLVGFDLKPFYTWLLRRGVRPAAPAFDAAVAAYLLDPGRGSYHLADIARAHGLGDLPEGDGPAAAAARAAALAPLRQRLEAALAQAGLLSLFREVEMPLLPILAQMEATGVRVDRSALEAMGQELDQRIQAVQQEIWQEVGYPFNLNSPRELADVLFGKLGLPVVKKTPKGAPSTDAEVLEELAAQAPVVARILDYRTLVKLKSTYVDGLVPLVEADGRIHTTFHQTVAATGRLSSSDPNLQNIPIRLEEGRRLRQVFIPAEGWVLLAADYSQIELRVLAHFSQDPALIDAFRRDQDIHTRTAAEVFGVPMDQVDRDMRRKAKAVNFGLVYGQTDFGLARALGIPRGEARAFIDRYFERYPGVKRYMEEKVREAREKGYVTTLLGRRRLLPDIHARTFAVRQNAERAAINTPIQGTAADLMKLAMIRVHRALAAAGLEARMLLQVHDELVFECPPGEVARLRDLVVREMEGALRLDVPLKVEVKCGPNWYAMEPLEDGHAGGA